MYPENPGSGTLVLAQPRVPARARSISANGHDDHHQRARCLAQHVLRQVAEDQRHGRPEALHDYSDLRKGATLDWTLSPTATGWGTARRRMRRRPTPRASATVGYLASQTVTVAPG